MAAAPSITELSMEGGCMYDCRSTMMHPSDPYDTCGNRFCYHTQNQKSVEEVSYVLNHPINIFRHPEYVIDRGMYSLEGVWCGIPRVKSSKYCLKHVCAVSDCIDPIMTKYDIHCMRHICNYPTGGCKNVRSEHSIYCVQHTCIKCDRLVVDEKQQFCEDHIGAVAVCSFESCRNTVCLDFRVPYPIMRGHGVFCQEHTCFICHDGQILSEELRVCFKCGEKSTDEKTRNMMCLYTGYDSDHLDGGDSRTCAYYRCKDLKVKPCVEMGDCIYRSKYCYRHTFLNYSCCTPYGFKLTDLRLLDTLGPHIAKLLATPIEESDAAKYERYKLVLMVGVKRVADLICSTPDGGQPHFERCNFKRHMDGPVIGNVEYVSDFSDDQL